MKKIYTIKSPLITICLIILSILFFEQNCFAQNRTIDSLLSLIKTDKSDTNNVIHLYKLAGDFQQIGDYENGLKYGIKSLNRALELDFKKGIANANNNLGNIYNLRVDYTHSLNCFFNAIKIDEELKNKKGMATRLHNIGNVYKEMGDYSKALDYFLKALKIDEELKNKRGIANHLYNIGNIYIDQGDYPKTLNYYFEALKMAEGLRDMRLKTFTCIGIGTVYYHQGNFSKSLDFYSEALKIAIEFEYVDLKVNIRNGIGAVYDHTGDYSKALEYYLTTLKMAQKFGYQKEIGIALGNIGSLYIKTGKFKDAELYLKRAIIINDSAGALNYLQQSEESLSNLYDTTGKYDLALIHYKKAVALKDTLFSQEQKTHLLKNEMKYNFDKQEATIKAENEKQQVIAEERSRKQKFIIWSVTGGLFLVFIFAGFVFRSLRITRKQKLVIEHQKKLVDEHQKEIIDSINYAKRIQNALLREEEHVSKHLPDHFILFQPKDIVSGDFYWAAEKQDYWYFAVVDCTGHGVPGAIMSMLGISFLNDIVSSDELLSPAEILNRLRDRVISELGQTGEEGGSKDGMDISLGRLHLKTNELQWAGANNALNLIRNSGLEEIKANKQPIGYHIKQQPFTNHEIQLQKGDCIYIYSDGYADQFGGPKGKKFTYKRLENLILAQNKLSMKEQKEFFKNEFAEWKGSLEQVDDVCIMSIRI